MLAAYYVSTFLTTAESLLTVGRLKKCIILHLTMDQLSQIRDILHTVTVLSDSEWEAFKDRLIMQEFEKDEHLCREGQTENYIYFIEGGACRSYFLKDGREYTLDFFFSSEFVTSYTSFLTREPSQVNIQALVKTKTFKIHYNSLQSLYDQYHHGERVGRVIAEKQFIKRSRKEMELLSLTAEDRYRSLFKKNPALVGQISVKHLSSYLGIHPESLSRIRNKIAVNVKRKSE